MSLLDDPEFSDFLKTKALLLGSYLTFVRVFFELKTGRKFLLSDPIGRESHFISIAKNLRRVFDGQSTRLIINVPPGHSKTTMLCYFIAWCYANYPDCNFIYVSYSHELAEKATGLIKEIISMPLYKKYFDARISDSVKSRGNFIVTDGKGGGGGRCVAVGAAGTITGLDAGLPGDLERFGGGIIIDDAHKVDEAHSDTLRNRVTTNYKETLKYRLRGPRACMIFIGQRVHEDDLANFLISGGDGYEWEKVILPALDEVDNALFPENFPKENLLVEREVSPYAFAGQQQQCPQPSGGGIFKPQWFPLLLEEPKIISTFISVDSAESEKFTADYTVFSFFGIYKIIYKGGIDTGQYGLHWIDCYELKCEPKDIEDEFIQFYMECSRHRVKPQVAVIEKKSSGTALISVLKSFHGLRVLPIERGRDRDSGRPFTKIDRFLECQPYAASGKITFPKAGKHTEATIEHLRKITANNTHRHDDRADTMQQAIQCALIEGILLPSTSTVSQDRIIDNMAQRMNRLNELKKQVYHG